MRAVIPVNDMHCASCAVSIERALSRDRGVKAANVNFALGRALVEFDEKKTSAERLRNAIRRAGYEPAVRRDASAPETPRDSSGHAHAAHAHGTGPRKIELALAIALAAPLVLFMIRRPQIGAIGGRDAAAFLALAIGWTLVAVFGRTFHRSTIRALRRMRANMDTLVTLGSFSAIGWSTFAYVNGRDLYAEVAGLIIVFLLVGKYIESRARMKTGQAIEALLALHPSVAHRILTDGTIADVNPATLALGDRCLVKPGEQVPTDGIITEGTTTIDESMLTGEPIPAAKSKGDPVAGGTLNASGSVTISVTAAAGQTALDAIIRTVEHALMTKSPVERFADIVSSVFVPVTIGIALLTLLGWIAAGAPVGHAVQVAVAVLIVACPCALGLATPAALTVGAGAGAKRGILFKEGGALEAAHAIDTIVFDKTGTLTQGKPSVTDLLGKASGTESYDLLRTAVALERPSEHPFAHAILTYAETGAASIPPERVEAFRAVAGKGVEGRLDGIPVALGTESFMTERGIRIPDDLRAPTDELRREAKTIMFVARGREVIGAIAAQDRVRMESAGAIAALKKRGLRVIMITGDHLASANAVARSLDIADVYADVSPTKKAEIVSRLQSEGRRVAFVGDGMNDAPALARADLGIAIGTGADVAIATGEIVILNGSPANVVEAIDLARATFGAIRQNLFWAFIYNVVSIPLAAFGYLNPMIAAVAMSLSSVSVLGNSIRVARRMRNRAPYMRPVSSLT